MCMACSVCFINSYDMSIHVLLELVWGFFGSGIAHTIFQFKRPCQIICQNSSWSTLLPILNLVRFYTFANLMVVNQHVCGFDSHQLISSHVQHLSKHSLDICVSSPINCLSISFVHFYIRDLFFLIFIWRCSLYILILKREFLCALQNFLPVGRISFINLWVFINSILLEK